MEFTPFLSRPHPWRSIFVEPLEARIAPATLLLTGTPGDDLLTVTTSGPDSGSYQLNGAPAVPFVDVTYFEFQGGDGDDHLEIVNPGGSVFAPVNGIVFAGGNHSTGEGDVLTVSGDGGLGLTESWIPEENGVMLKTGNAVISQVIHCSGLERIMDLAPALSLTVLANHGNNAIDYVSGAQSNGLLTVDGLVPLEFANKTFVVVEALAGYDVINLNNSGTPAGLVGITVEGGDPSEGDVLIVNGTPGLLDNLRHIPTGNHFGFVVNDSQDQTLINFAGIEILKLVVQASDGDGFRQEGTFGSDRYEFLPAAAGTGGTIIGTMDFEGVTGLGPFSMTKTELIGFSAANDLDLGVFVHGGTDTLVFNGTGNADIITVGKGEGGGLSITDATNGEVVMQVEAFFTTNVIVRGHGGSDVFNVGSFVTASTLAVEGDEGANVLNFIGINDAVTTLTPSAGTITIPTALSVTYADFGSVSLAGAGIASSLLAMGTAANDTFVVTPTVAGAGSFTVTSAGIAQAQSVTFFYALQSAFSVISGGSGFDVLQIIGTEGADIITATASVVTVANSGLSKVTIGNGIDRLDVFALDGNDRVDLRTLSLHTRILGGAGDDVLIGTAQDDLIDGGAGRDVIHGGAGHNTVLNNGPFGFNSAIAYDVAQQPGAVVAVNLNGDDFDDLVVMNRGSGTVSVLLGTATGHFQDAVNYKTGGKSPNSVAAGDFNGDGVPDLAVTNEGSKNIGILIGNGDGAFAAVTKIAVGKPLLGLQAANLDNDLHTDLVALSGPKLVMLTGVGDGTFNAAKLFATGGTKPVALVIADFNQDGLKDVATANSGSANISFLPGAPAGFGAAVTFKAGAQPGAICTGDFDGDGKPDLAVTNKASKFVSILRGNGNTMGSQFGKQFKVANPGKITPTAIATTDFNGDGVLDLAIANSAAGSFRVLLGIGDALFATPVDFSLGDDPKTKVSALVIGDFDGDGASDIAAAGPGTANVSVALQVVG